MEHAWLDSLSEDWISQAASDTSAAQLPPLKSTKQPETSPVASPFPPSRIPRRSQGPGHKPPTHDTSTSILVERSTNEINIARQRLAAKLSKEGKASRSGIANRTVSGGSSGSVVHNTVQQRSPSSGDRAETPEWKRRLIYGDIQYGEHRDLFCSAATGLQDMFKPPQAGNERDGFDHTPQPYDFTMASSPPLGGNMQMNAELEELLNLEDDEEADHPAEVTPSPSPRRPQRQVRYKLNVDDSFNASIISDGSVRRNPNSAEQEQDGIFHDSSCLSVPTGANTVSRRISGFGDTRNEDFSLILLGKHNDEDGKLDFAPLEMPADQLRQRLERLRLSQMVLDPQADPQPDADNHTNEQSATVETSEEYARNGGFVNFRRGGRSDEGSFRNRVLSSEMGADSSEMLPEESLQASTPKQFPTVRSERTNPYEVDSPAFLPRAPFPSPEKRLVEETFNEQSAGSPLKLFGPYDTFTNQTLLRRISQFEETMSGRTSSQSSDPAREDEINGQHPQQAPRSQPRSISQFGAGQLEGFEFSGDLSYEIYDESGYLGKENISPRSPLTPSALFELPSRDLSPDQEPELQIRRRRRKPGILAALNGVDLSPPSGASDIGGKRDNGSDKRPRTSPSKDPTPKRRRTLHRSDIAFGNENRLAGVDSAHKKIQYILENGGKNLHLFRPMDAPVLGRRSIMRPRTPTPSQRSSLQREQHPASEMFYKSSQGRLNGSPIKSAHNDTHMSVQQSAETTRKPSIRTQDFVDQAAQIMAMIRSQVSQPGLASLLESEGETGLSGLAEAVDDVSDDSTNEPLSRPPSREGKFVSWFPQRQEDPELLNRLKKYQELSDMGDIISSSVRSMGLAKDAIRAAQEVERMIEESSRSRSDAPFITEGDVISDIANIRLSTKASSLDELASPIRDFYNSSAGRSMSGAFPSGSSRGSESRRIIMPESVSHLIPDRIGGMYLDKRNNIWIKKKEQRQESSSTEGPSDDSEDDPFASIPDLTVDETKELQQLKLKNEDNDDDDDDDDDKADASFENPSFAQLHEDCTDQARDSGMATRAVGELKKLDRSLGHAATVNDEAEHNLEFQEDKISNPTSTVRRRNLTITFSSPVASFIQDMLPEDLDSLEDDPDISEAMKNVSILSADSPMRSSPVQPTSRNMNQASSRGRGTPAYGSVHRSFIPRPVSRIDEQDEESTVEIPIIHASLAFILNRTPAGKALTLHGEDSLLIGQHIGRLSLSPLSEFTLRHHDQSFGLEVSYVLGQRHMATGDGSKRVLSMTIRELVDKLAEVEPFEPYWEDMTELDLHDKNLTSLHMLDEFCGKVTTLDASNNALAHLDGVPSCVRHLKLSHNMLTELTSWDHLFNLQYVDISGNEVKTLSALRGLVHLRSLRADNNRLTSLDGLDSHDGLLSLRARDNLIEELDATELKLQRLAELDLGGNRITSVQGLEALSSLSQLNLGGNQLQVLSFNKQLRTLRQLDVSDNELTSLDIRNLPNLQSLHVDGNRIQELSGFRHARRLDSLSLREQRVEPLDLGFLASACEVRKLFLSGNYLKSFEPRADFLNLQLLELANCGLQELPKELGQMMPNLRMLNLNFNAISNLGPLRFIPRMKKLLVAGNRLADSTSVTELLTDFPHLTQLDLRDNPITQGFYPPVQVLVTAERTCSDDPFTLPEADLERDATFSRRLDEPTKLRRRLHEVVFVASCKRLRKLDGLLIKRSDVLARDPLLQTLIDEGLVPELDDTLVAEPESMPRPKEATPELIAARAEAETEAEAHMEQETEEPQSSRWHAEDSFA
ncbi:Septation initiation network scaffold protein cdc11 [Cladobotryum mycophilum]|uniref:Septation initiation network scaffold protein cdc11 n=1 Tax=Cladobotryum mycophilum TaxID=491253 RepID=A0ABR0SZU6_9HYPO